MLGASIVDRKSVRHEATRREILDAAWELSRERGLAGVSLRDLARRVGMQAPSLYSYFSSKAAIYGAMFADGNRVLLERLTAVPRRRDPRRLLLTTARAYLEFCIEDPVRHQLLFQRTIPNFEPSPDQYADAVAVLDVARELLVSIGITDASALDLWTALVTGLADQQLSNDPGGDRWTRLLPRAVDMFLAHHGEGLT